MLRVVADGGVGVRGMVRGLWVWGVMGRRRGVVAKGGGKWRRGVNGCIGVEGGEGGVDRGV